MHPLIEYAFGTTSSVFAYGKASFPLRGSRYTDKRHPKAGGFSITES